MKKVKIRLMLSMAATVSTVSLSAFAAGSGIYDVSVGDFPRLTGENGDSARIMRAVDAVGGGGVVWFPRGEYKIDSMLVVSNSASLLLHKSAVLKAVSQMPFVMRYFGRLMEAGNGDSSGIVDHNLFIRGGEFNGNGLAGCVHLMGVRHFTMSDITFRNGRDFGLQIGEKSLPRAIEGGYEIIANNLYFICNLPGLAGNVGLQTNIGDSHFTDIVIVDYTTGIRDLRASNRYTRCHIWGGLVKHRDTGAPEMLDGSVAFDLQANDAMLTDCYADTAMTGFWVRGDSRIVNCGYFNNWRFKMDNPTVFRHEAGRLTVVNGRFSKNSPNAALYTCGRDAGRLVWRDNYVIKFSDLEQKELNAKIKKEGR